MINNGMIKKKTNIKLFKLKPEYRRRQREKIIINTLVM